MATRILEIDLRKGSGNEPVYGVVTVQRKSLGLSRLISVLPWESEYKLVDGKVTIEIVSDGTGPYYDSAYLFRVKLCCGRHYGVTKVVPDGNSPVTLGELPDADVSEDKDLYMDAGSWNEIYLQLLDRAERAEEAAKEAAALVGAPSGDIVRAVVDYDLSQPSSKSREVLGRVYSPLTTIDAKDNWSAHYGKKISLPTPDPVSGAGQVVHPSVQKIPGRFGGYLYWMAYTPYEGGNDAYEDPCVVASNDGTNWELPTGIPFPLDDAPGGTRYNSDTNLVYANGELHCFWRYLDTSLGSNQEMIYVRKSSDGVNWTPKQLVHSSSIGQLRILAPSFEYFDGKWHLWGVDLNQTNRPLVYRTATELGGVWSTPENCTLPTADEYTPWHVAIRRQGSRFVGILNDTKIGGYGGRYSNIYLISSADGKNWVRGSEPLVPRIGTEHIDMYAATLVVEAGGIDIWYSAIDRNPSIWNIFRTRATIQGAGTPYAVASGVVVADSVPANGGKSTVEAVFPSQMFSKPPIVVAMSANGRCNTSLESTPTVDSVLINVYNWTSGGATSPRVQWVAVQMDK